MRWLKEIYYWALSRSLQSVASGWFRSFYLEGDIRLYSRGILFSPGNWRFYNSRGWAFHKLGRNTEALNDFDRALELAPENGSVYRNRGRLYLKAGKHSKALRDFERAVNSWPRTGDEYFLRATLWMDMGNHAHAKDDYTRDFKKNPKREASYMGRAEAFYELGCLSDAAQDAEKALKLNPKNEEALLLAGNCYSLLNNNEEALKKANALVRLDPKYSGYYKFRAEILQADDEDGRANADLEKALSLDSKDSESWSQVELLDWDIKNADAERKCSSKILSLLPKTGVPLLRRGLHCEQKGMFEEAVASFSEALSLVEDDPDAYYFRARVLFKLDKLDESYKDICTAIKLSRNNYACFYLRGRIYEHRCDTRGALYDYSMAITLNPSCAPAYKRRGAVYFDLGEKVKAMADAAKAKELESIKSAHR